MRAILALFLSMLCSSALASDWVVDRVRGDAVRLESGAWTPLAVGAVIDTGDQLQTGPNGRLTLARGDETIELAGGTQVRIHDEGAEHITVVAQQSGQVLVDVERRNVEHFSVQTPYMAAVVKGTRFIVTVGAGTADVQVERGEVQVQDSDNQLFANVGAGGSASVAADVPLSVTGGNAVVYNMNGTPQDVGERSSPAGAQSDQRPSGPAAQGNGPPAHSNAGGNSGENRSGPPDHSNAGGNGNGNGNAGSNAGGNGNSGNAGGGDGGNSDNNDAGSGSSSHGNAPDHSNAGGNGNGGGGGGGSGGGGGGPPAHSNAGGNH